VTIKIKFLSGKRKDQVLDIEEVQAKSFIEDGIAEEVKAEDPMESALKGFEVKANEIAQKALADATAKAMEQFAKGLGRVTQIKVGPDRELEDPTSGFKSMNHFLHEVVMSGINCGTPTPLMKKHFSTQSIITKTAGPSGNTEGSPSLTPGTGDGAVIPVQYAAAIFQMYGEQDDFQSMCFPFPMNSLSAHLPIMRNYDRSNTTATAGVVVTEPGEATVIPVSKTTWEQRLFTLVKESVMVPVSNEAIDDNNVGLGMAISAQAVWQLRKQINGGILAGFSNGAAGPSCVGIIGGSATKLVGRAVANQVSFADLLNMYAAFSHQDADYGQAVWIGHPTIISQLGTTTIGNFPALFSPGGGASGQPLSILGRPLILSGWAKTLGTSGDLLLVDLKRYIMGFKGGVTSFVSPHVYAASDQTGFRFSQRVNGQQGLTGLITLEDGSTKVSPFVEQPLLAGCRNR
jgi:HK97 family phage major capsid protein